MIAVEDVYEVYLERKTQNSEQAEQLREELGKTLCDSLGNDFFLQNVERLLIEYAMECRKEAYTDGFKAGVNLMLECSDK